MVAELRHVTDHDIRPLQAAKAIWDETLEDSNTQGWFDYSRSGDKAISLMFTRGEPIDPQKSVPPWEPGSEPPPFMKQMQQLQGSRANSADAGLSQ